LLKLLWRKYVLILYQTTVSLSPFFLLPTIVLYAVAVLLNSQEVAASGLALAGVYIGIITVIGIVSLPYLLLYELSESRYTS